MLRLKNNVTEQELEAIGLVHSGHKINPYYYVNGIYVEIDVNTKTHQVDITVDDDLGCSLTGYDADLLFKVLNSGLFEVVEEEEE